MALIPSDSNLTTADLSISSLLPMMAAKRKVTGKELGRGEGNWPHLRLPGGLECSKWPHFMVTHDKRRRRARTNVSAMTTEREGDVKANVGSSSYHKRDLSL
jgi:hypothetical protein